MIAFTVMDHDVITANDFAGEAFLSLNHIPGVGGDLNMGVENFHGLKQIDLVLMQQKDKSKHSEKLEKIPNLTGSCELFAHTETQISFSLSFAIPFLAYRSSHSPDSRDSNL